LVDEVGKYLGASEDTAHAWLSQKPMPADKVGRLPKFNTHQVNDWAKGGGAADQTKVKK
jgi:excisionase family DNA binding protein